MRRACTAVLSVLLLAACAHRAAHVAMTPTPAPAQRAIALASPTPRVVALASPTPAPSTVPSPVTGTAAPALPTLAPYPMPRLGESLFDVLPTQAPSMFVMKLPTITPPSVPMMPPDASPMIVDIEMPVESVTPGETVSGIVLASSNVASVEVRIARFGRPMEKISPGHFWIELQVPRLPFFLRHRTYTIEIIARNTRGDAVSREVPVTVR